MNTNKEQHARNVATSITSTISLMLLLLSIRFLNEEALTTIIENVKDASVFRITFLIASFLLFNLAWDIIAHKRKNKKNKY